MFSPDANLTTKAQRNVSGNQASADALSTRMQRIWSMRQRAPSCLDLRHYLRHNPDLPRDWGQDAALMHLARYGQFEQRPFRYGRAFCFVFGMDAPLLAFLWTLHPVYTLFCCTFNRGAELLRFRGRLCTLRLPYRHPHVAGLRVRTLRSSTPSTTASRCFQASLRRLWTQHCHSGGRPRRGAWARCFNRVPCIASGCLLFCKARAPCATLGVINT